MFLCFENAHVSVHVSVFVVNLYLCLSEANLSCHSPGLSCICLGFACFFVYLYVWAYFCDRVYHVLEVDQEASLAIQAVGNPPTSNPVPMGLQMSAPVPVFFFFFMGSET